MEAAEEGKTRGGRCWEFSTKKDPLSEHELWLLLSPSKNKHKNHRNICTWGMSRFRKLAINISKICRGMQERHKRWCTLSQGVFQCILNSLQPFSFTRVSNITFPMIPSSKTALDALLPVFSFVRADGAISIKNLWVFNVSDESNTLNLTSYHLKTPSCSNKSPLKAITSWCCSAWLVKHVPNDVSTKPLPTHFSETFRRNSALPRWLLCFSTIQQPSKW